MSHVAELNIGRLKYDVDDPRLADFMDNLDKVNAIAERAEGFVWRLTGDGDNATDIIHDGMNVNMSVWESAEALEQYVWNTVHARFYRRKPEWFDHIEDRYFVMWPVAEGHIPTLDEAFARLAHLQEHGSTDHAYGWEGMANLKRWMEAQCGAA